MASLMLFRIMLLSALSLSKWFCAPAKDALWILTWKFDAVSLSFPAQVTFHLTNSSTLSMIPFPPIHKFLCPLLLFLKTIPSLCWGVARILETYVSPSLSPFLAFLAWLFWNSFGADWCLEGCCWVGFVLGPLHSAESVSMFMARENSEVLGGKCELHQLVWHRATCIYQVESWHWQVALFSLASLMCCVRCAGIPEIPPFWTDVYLFLVR